MNGSQTSTSMIRLSYSRGTIDFWQSRTSPISAHTYPISRSTESASYSVTVPLGLLSSTAVAVAQVQERSRAISASVVTVRQFRLVEVTARARSNPLTMNTAPLTPFG